MGFFYEAMGDTSKAVAHYTTALSMKEDPGLRQKMEDLKKRSGK
jgi:hypothetical protein